MEERKTMSSFPVSVLLLPDLYLLILPAIRFVHILLSVAGTVVHFHALLFFTLSPLFCTV